jgi:hypothetical protein
MMDAAAQPHVLGNEWPPCAGDTGGSALITPAFVRHIHGSARLSRRAR